MIRDQPAALAVMQQAITELDAAGAEDRSMFAVHLMVSMNAANSQDFRTARAQAEEALRIARRTGMPSLVTMASFGLGEALALSEPGPALASFEESVAASRRGATDMVLSPALAQIGRLKAATGDAAGATHALEEAIVQADDVGYRPSVIGALQQCVHAFASLELDEPAAVIAGVVTEGPLAEMNYRFDSMAAHQQTALEGVRSRLGDERYLSALKYGAHLTYEEVIQYARHLFEERSSDPAKHQATGGS